MIEFLLNNIVWVIVVIIVLMAIIGYYAENSELGKKIMKPKEKKPKPVKKTEKPQTFEEAIKQIDKNEGIASVIDKEKEKTMASLEKEKNETILESVAEDAWSTNVDTDVQKPQEVVEANPDEWLNAPVNVSKTEENEEISSETDMLENNGLYNLPNTDEIPEITVTELPSGKYANIEVLDISDEFDNVQEMSEVKEENNDLTDAFDNPVEETLAQLDNSNQVLENDLQEDVEATIEKTLETEDIWK